VTSPAGRAAGALPTLPLDLRNRLAELIIRSLSDADARRTLIDLASRRPAAPPSDWLTAVDEAAADTFCERVRRAATAIAACPLAAGAATDLPVALRGAAALFDAGLYFEVHELLEPNWGAARGSDREALQGLIQIAVGYQHLANGNLKGARALLAEGSSKVQARRLRGVDLDAFASEVRLTLARVAEGTAFDWTRVPAFPREP
jgi:predicted metal-dependent hydrolase